MVKDENEALDLASRPERIIDPLDCNIVIGYLNGVITDLDMKEFEGQIAAKNYKVELLHTQGKTNALAIAEWEVSEIYIKWQKIIKELRKLRAFRSVLKEKEKILMSASSYTRNNYQRAI